MAGRPKKKPHLINGVPYWRCSSCGDYKPGEGSELKHGKNGGLG